MTEQGVNDDKKEISSVAAYPGDSCSSSYFIDMAIKDKKIGSEVMIAEQLVGMVDEFMQTTSSTRTAARRSSAQTTWTKRRRRARRRSSIAD